MLVRDALLAYVHFALILSLAGFLAAEVALYRTNLTLPVVNRLRTIDAWYGGVAGLIILSGISRVLFGLKGAAFYIHNPVFWVKMALFLAVAILSVPPTRHFGKLAKLAVDGSTPIDDPTFERVRRFLLLEVVTLALIPLAAVFMARGL